MRATVEPVDDSMGIQPVRAIRFSIVVTCHNQRDFIQAAVDSAVSQRYPLKEVVVVDDASGDGSLERLQQYVTNIHLVTLSDNCGAVAARNRGVAVAKGEYLVFLDGDDVLLPWALEMYERIIAERTPKIIAGQTTTFNGAVPPVTDSDWPAEIAFVEYDSFFSKDRPYGMCASALVVHRETFLAVGGWSAGIFQLDLQDLVSKLGCAGHVIMVCSPSSALYRIHASNSVHTVFPFVQNARRLMAKERGSEYPGGRKLCFERRAWFGGLIFFWVKRAVRAGLYRDALSLALSGQRMILAAILRRSVVRVMGRRPVESLELLSDRSSNLPADGSSIPP